MTLFSASALIFFGIIGIQVNKTVQTGSYSSKSEIKYNLNFIDDPLYNRNSIEFGNGYVAKFVNNIDLTFLYDFNCNKATDISGNYIATALMEATYNNSDLIWKKEFQIIPQTEFKTGQATESINLPVKDYIDFIENLQQNIGVITSVKLTITYTANASAVIDGKTVDDSSEATLVIPITGDVIVMGGSPVNEQSKALEAEVSQDLLPKKEMLIGSIIFLVLLSGALLYLLKFTTGIQIDPIQLQLNIIFKKYSSRIIELYSDTQLENFEAIFVKSFKDLLLSADEMKKPIFKNDCTNYNDTEFYVFDNIKAYVFKAQFLNNKGDKPLAKTIDLITINN